MLKERFYECFREELSRKLGEEYEVKLQTILKNNGVRLQGLMIMEKRKNVFPTIYLDSFYEEALEGKKMEDMVGCVEKLMRKDMAIQEVDMEFFQHYDKVKNRICYKLINQEMNRELLEDIPYIPFLDLAICFFFDYCSSELGNGSILIRKEHMDKWKVSTRDLWKTAHENTVRLYPAENKSIFHLIVGMMEQGSACCDREKRDCVADMDEAEVPMRVLSNRQRVFGAAVILYDGYLEEVADTYGCDLYILPSSIHEVIVLPADEVSSGMALQDIIKEVNSTEIEFQEILSNSLYYYDRSRKNVSLIR